MAADYSMCLGTAGWGVWHSPDAGGSWVRHRAPFPLNSRIQALVAHPAAVYRSRDGGLQWEKLTVDIAPRGFDHALMDGTDGMRICGSLYFRP